MLQFIYNSNDFIYFVSYILYENVPIEVIVYCEPNKLKFFIYSIIVPLVWIPVFST